MFGQILCRIPYLFDSQGCCREKVGFAGSHGLSRINKMHGQTRMQPRLLFARECNHVVLLQNLYRLCRQGHKFIRSKPMPQSFEQMHQLVG